MKRSSIFYALPIFGMAIASAFMPSAAIAGSVTPLVLELEASGTKKAGALQYKNNGAKPLAMELKISRLKLDENGKQNLEPAQSDFAIFPPLASIPAGNTQAIRVQWAGTPALSNSESYIFSLKELPVKFPNALSGMQLVVDFNVVVNVAPINGIGSMNVVSSSFGKDEKGIPRPQIIVENKGNRHINLSDAVITLSSGEWTQTLPTSALRQMIGVGLVQPGKRRRFLFPIPSAPQAGALAARVDHPSLVTSSTAK